MLTFIKKPPATQTNQLDGFGGSGESHQSTNPPSKMNKTKQWLMVGGVFFFVMIMVGGLLVTYKQRTTKQNVAPNAPESKPQAAIPESNICHLEVVVEEPSVTITPTGITAVVCEGANVTPKPAYDGDLVTYTSGTRKIETQGGSTRVHMRYLKDGAEQLLKDTSGLTRTTTASAELADKIYFATIITRRFADGISRDCVVGLTPSWNNKMKRPLSTGLWMWHDPKTGTKETAPIVDGYQCLNSCTAVTDVLLPGTTPTATPSATPTSTPSGTIAISATPTPTTTYACNSSCELDSQCQAANADYVCSADYGNVCRLDSNQASETCQPAERSYACNSSCTDDGQCQTVNANYICAADYGNVCRLASNPTASNCQPAVYATPTPAPGCNDICQTNADCSANPNYICYQTPDGTNRCRLDAYPNSDSCTAPQQVAAAQPTLPPELPKTGPAEWLTWMKVGLATLGIGGALLLLL